MVCVIPLAKKNRALLFNQEVSNKQTFILSLNLKINLIIRKLLENNQGCKAYS